MAVFKIAKGLSKDLPVKKTEGYSWITADDGKIYIDFSDVERICIDNIPTHLAQLLEDDQNRVITEGYYYNNNFYMDSAHESQYTPKPNKIYLDFTSRKLYYYENDSYVEVSSSLEIGETADTAYRGDRGKIAYDHSQVTSGNPHQVTKAEIGLNKVENFKAVSTEESQGLTDTEKLNARANIGLGTVAVRDAGVSGGIAELDSNGKVLSSQLPSFVDDVIEYASQSGFPVTGETGKIYVDTTTNLTYRWSGSSYVEISQSLALGETASTAFRGDLGKEAYDHATAKGSAFNNGLYKIATNAEGHVTDATLVVKQDITNLGIIDDSLPAETSGTDKSLVTTGEKAQWNEKTTVEESSNNGNIIIDGVETTVYTHPGSGTNPHGTTKQDLGLENVGNFKAVSTEANQGLTNTEQENARINIGAGTSSFSGVYNDLTGKPTLGTASEKDVASSGNASTSQVVMGNDTRLSDARPASDVSSWAKASTKPTYTASEVGLGNVGNFKAVSTVVNQGLTDTEKSNARANIGAGTSSFSGAYNDLTGKPTLGTASEKDVSESGDAASTEVVMGNDSRLTDSRNAADVSAWAKASTKPTYTASEVGAIASTLKGANNGVAELDSSGKVPSSQLPSYVDDVIECEDTSHFPISGETGKIYIDQTTNKTYRWGGTDYVEISESLALGETSSAAYRGDRGKTAYDHSQVTSGNPHNVTKSDVGLSNVGNFKAVSTEASQGLTTTEQTNARANIGAGTSSFSGSYNDLTNKPTLGTAAATDSSSYATAAQGTKADNAMPKSGGTFTGAVILNGDPSANLGAATKNYVDTQVNTVESATQVAISAITPILDSNNIVDYGDGGTSSEQAISSALAAKANIASPTFTGTPTAPTATKGTDNTQIATTAFVQDEVSDLKNALTHITGNTMVDNYVNDKSIDTSGSTVDITSEIANVGLRYAIIDVSAGDKFTINGTGGSLPRLWCFIDSSGNVLSKANSGATATDLLITAPANSSKLIIQNFIGSGDSYLNEIENLKVDILKRETRKFGDIFGAFIVEGATDIQKNLYSNIVDIYVEGNPATFKDMRVACARNTTSYPHEIILITPNNDLVYGSYRDTGYNRFIQGNDTVYIKIDWANYSGNYYLLNYDNVYVQITGVFAYSYNGLCNLPSEINELRSIIPNADFIKSSANETGYAQRTGYIVTNVSIGSTVDTTVVADYGWYNAVIPVSKGESFHIQGIGGTGPTLYALLDSNKKLLSKAPAEALTADIIVAENGFLVFNSRVSGTLGVYKTDTSGYVSSVSKELEKTKKTFSWSSKPEEPYFVLSLDCAKKYFTVANIKAIIDEISDNGFNQLQIQFSTNIGFRLELDDMTITDVNGNSFDLTPCLGGDENPTKWYNQTEMDDIIAYAHAKGIDMYPFFEMPNHMRRILTTFPQFGDAVSLDLSNPNAVNFALALVDRYSKYFASRGCHFWNFGFDEQDFASAYSGGTFGKIIDFGNKLIDLINANGLTPRMYNDGVLYNKDYMYQVKKDVEVMCWRYYTDQYATNIADFNEIQQAGYKIINSSAWLYYIDGSGLDIDINVLPTMDILKYWHGMSFYFNHLVSGAVLSVWCDQSVTQNPGDGGAQVTSDILPIIDAFGDAIKMSKLLHE